MGPPSTGPFIAPGPAGDAAWTANVGPPEGGPERITRRLMGGRCQTEERLRSTGAWTGRGTEAFQAKNVPLPGSTRIARLPLGPASVAATATDGSEGVTLVGITSLPRRGRSTLYKTRSGWLVPLAVSTQLPECGVAS